MQARVLKSYRDKYTRRAVKTGVEIEVEAGRVAEINSAPGGPFIEVVAEDKPKKAKKKEG